MSIQGTNSSRRYYDEIGFFKSDETRPGVYENEIASKKYYGDLITNYKRVQTSDQINDGIYISTKISILADMFAQENFHHIVYAKLMGVKWKVTEVEPASPRLILTLGDEYIE